ncbi:MAG: hypothetical protein U0232_04900 [Thermomicrobiales bacterium]
MAVPSGPLAAQDLADLEESFGREHERTYGHRAGENEPVELVSLRLVARGLHDRDRLPAYLHAEPQAGGDRPGTAAAPRYFGKEWSWLETPVVGRDAVPLTPRSGPLIVEEYDAHRRPARRDNQAR